MNLCLNSLSPPIWSASIYFLPVSPKQTPCLSPFRAPTDGVWVGEQLCSEDVPVPVCKFEQLYILHRFLSWKVGWQPRALQFLFTPNLMSNCAKMFYFKLPCHDCQASFPFPFSLYIWVCVSSCFSIYKILLALHLKCNEVCVRALLDIITTFKFLFFPAKSLLVFLWLNFTANVANLNLLRFAGRPGKYNKLFNRWRLEEVSAIRHHHK